MGLSMTGCTGASTTVATSSTEMPQTVSESEVDPSEVVAALGAFPIPTAEPADPTPTAVPGAPQLLAIGAPVQVNLPDTAAVVTALGPEQLATPTGPATPGDSVDGRITLTAQVTSGALTLAADELTSRDQTGTVIPLAPTGPAAVTVATGTSGSLQVDGHFSDGSAQVTWTHDGHVIALWDFTIEID